MEDDQHVAIEEVPEFLTATEKEELCGHLQNFQSNIFSQQDMLILCQMQYIRSLVTCFI